MHVQPDSPFSSISTKHPKRWLMVVFVCVCRSPPVLPGTTKAPLLKLSRVVLGTIVRSHMETGENTQKIIQAVFSQTFRFIRKCSLAPCALLLGSKKRTHPDRSACCTYFAKIEVFRTDFALKHIVQKVLFSIFPPKPSAGPSQKPSADPKIVFPACPHIC